MTMLLSRSAFALPALLLLAAATSAQPLAGQIVRDPDHPQYLMRLGGSHVFICGPGDPEDFLYRGTRLPDGTRDGDQVALIQRLIDEGGNSIYMETIRSHGGDGGPDHNPFVDSNPALGIDEDILDQWEEWFTFMDENDILIYLFIYDDGSRIWNTGDVVGAAEEAYVQAIIDRFEHHRNLIFNVSEESEEAMTDARTRAVAVAMAAADDHDHVMGNHHHSGTHFNAWGPGTPMNHFSMHLNVTGDAIHEGAKEAFDKAVEKGVDDNAYQVIYSECLVVRDGDIDIVRRFLWASAMAGVQSMALGMDIWDTPTVSLNHCRYVQQFFEGTDFYTMEHNDELAHLGTKWVLADPGQSYIAYADPLVGDMGVKGMTGGVYDLLWIDCITGVTVAQTGLAVPSGDHGFVKPGAIGAECAVWITRTWTKLGKDLAGTSGAPQLSGRGRMFAREPIWLTLTGAVPQARAVLVLGLQDISLPFKGGIFVPSPDWLFHRTVRSDGSVEISTSWPAGVPSGLTTYYQFWVQDAGGPAGFAASNAVTWTSP